MTRLVNLKTFVVLSFVSTFIAACGVQPSNMNQADVSKAGSLGFSTLAETRTEAQIREDYYRAHFVPAAKPTEIPVVKKPEAPKPVATTVPVAKKEENKSPQIIRVEPPKPTATPVKTIEAEKPMTSEERKAREEYYRAHFIPAAKPTATPIIKKVEAVKTEIRK